MKDLNIALASGVLFIASYFSLQTHYLSDSGDFRPFSTTQSQQQQQKSQNIFLLSDEQVTNRLRNLEESYFVNRGKGVVRYDISQLPSNNPIEDDRSEAVVTVPTKDGNADFYFWGIYDGHSGYYTSLKLRDELIGHVVGSLGAAYKPEDSGDLRLVPSQDVIDDAIKNGFLQLDREIIHGGLTRLFEDPNNKETALKALPAASGSCALLTFYDSSTQLLKVAVTGDSRAVLGSLNENNEWTAKSLSVDQTGDNPEEVERIKKEHPDEPTCVSRGRVLGSLQPTRAFGDFRYKVKEIKGKAIESLPEHLRVYFRAPPKNSLTPPYVTAEPVVSTTKISPSKNDFVVIGSDGLYELLSNEEIVGLVVKWLEKHKLEDTKKWNLFSSDEKKLPHVIDVSDKKYREIQRPAFRNKKNSQQHEYLLEDQNVATHLIRNALSLGGSKEYVSTLVSIPSSKSRRYRDDLTVTVVFFGEGELNEDGKLEVNIPATKNGLSAEPKL
jgi:pyruvate dehydrogenase phosphatase